MTLPAQPALRHPVPPLESTGPFCTTNLAGLGGSPPNPTHFPGPRSLPAREETLSPPSPPSAPFGARPALHRLLKALQREGGNQAAAALARAGGSQDDMGNTEEDYNFVFKGEFWA